MRKLSSKHAYICAIDDLTQALQAARVDTEAVARVLGPSLLKVQPEDAIRTLETERRHVVLGHGLLSLPDELLALVFVTTMSDCYKPWITAFHLSAVCRRFHAITHSSPEMWSYVSTKMSRQEVVDMCLDRSRNASLHLSIVEGSPDFYSAIRQHCSRWESIQINSGREKYQTEVDKLLPDAALDALPRLQSIRVACGPRTSREVKKLVDQLNTSAPNVRHLTLTISTPSRYTLPASLRRLDLTVFPKSFTTPGSGSIRHLVSFLRSAPLLEEMKLDFLKTECFDPFTSQKSPGKQMIFSMPLVGKVKLSLRAHDGLQPLLRTLYFPNIIDLSIEVRDKVIDDWDDEEGYGGSPEPEIDNIHPGMQPVNAMFHRSKKYPRLTTLTLRLLFWDEAILRSNVTLDKDFLMNYAKNYPALQRLTLHCPTPIEELTLPPLRNLKLINCRLQCTNGSWITEKICERTAHGLHSGCWR